MLNNDDVEVLFGSTYNVEYPNSATLRLLKSSLNDFYKYRDFKIPFAFCGLSLMFRKEIISKFGLFSTLTHSLDTEFSLRITKLNVNLVYYNNPISIRLENEFSTFNPKSAYIFELENIFLLYALKTISDKSFAFLKLKFHSKAIIRKLFFSNKYKMRDLTKEFIVENDFLTEIIAKVRKDFNEDYLNSKLFIKSTIQSHIRPKRLG